MKRLLTSLAASAALFLAGTAFAAEGTKIASVDFRKIALESKAGTEARKALEKLTETLGKNLKKKEAELDKLRASLEGKAKSLTDKERSAKAKEFEKKIEVYRETAQDAQKELQGKGDEVGKKIMADVEKIVKDYAQKNGYALVIRNEDLLYNDGKNKVTDITDDVLKLYDAAQPEEATQKKP